MLVQYVLNNSPLSFSPEGERLVTPVYDNRWQIDNRWQTDCQRYLSLPRRITHPNLPKGKERVTLVTDFSPHLASPEGEGRLLLFMITDGRLIA